MLGAGAAVTRRAAHQPRLPHLLKLKYYLAQSVLLRKKIVFRCLKTAKTNLNMEWVLIHFEIVFILILVGLFVY